jgi:hypothetical protein
MTRIFGDGRLSRQSLKDYLSNISGASIIMRNNEKKFGDGVVCVFVSVFG